MQRVDGNLLFSPSDLGDFLECDHLTRLELAAACGQLERGEAENPHASLIRRKGEEHEQVHLASLEADGLRVVRIDLSRGWNAAARATEEAMRAGADVVYQAVLLDPRGWRGIADFLERTESPSGLGSWSYEVADTKLARTTKPHFLLQLAFYSEQVGRIQERLPERMHVVLGTRERATFRARDFDAYYRRVRRRFAEWVTERTYTYPYPVEHCAVCDWRDACTKQWEDDDHLTLVATMRRSWVTKLGEAAITTMEGLATAEEELETALRPEIYDRLRRQAQLQHRHRLTGEHAFELLPLVESRGLELLPKPSTGDIFFDIEGDPFYEASRGLEYLFGLTHRDNGDIVYRAFWATDRAAERRAFEELVDLLLQQLERFPDMHVYHYAHYEPTALKRLMSEWGTREDEVDELLRREIFVDLYRVVAESLRISHPRYGLKQIETFFLPPREEDVSTGDDSILVFEQWLEHGDRTLLDAIERYNELDCRATVALRDWLLERRDEAGVTRWKEPPVPRELTAETADSIAERERVRLALLADAEEGDERWILAQLLEYHRREDRPVWWHYFRRRELSAEDLVDDTEAIGDLQPTNVQPEEVKQSLIFTLEFPPQQHKLSAGETANPETEKSERIVEIDDALGQLRLKRGKRRDDPLPRALIPSGPRDTRAQRAALRRIAAEVLSPSGRYAALRDVLSREQPRTRGRLRGACLQGDDPRRIVSDLEDSYLFIQGPPGSGKTWTGARLVVHLLRNGQRVGVAAPSHKAIHNMLREIERVAAEEEVQFVGLKKCTRGSEDTRYEDGIFIENADGIEPFLRAEVQLLAGTAWLFAREELDGSLDHLFIDEAGQVSLADALAMGTSARNLVLLGDPLQLAQVSQGVHPHGTGCSVLEHLLGDDPTIPPDRGLFLERTWRMHPAVCRFISEIVYEGRLDPAEGMERQLLDGVDAGIRYLPVEHEGRSQSSPEEAARIAEEIERLIGRRYTAAAGKSWVLRYQDVMVVAPYNAQVRALRSFLPADVRVGTVDKFQGQEAPVVFYSTASSSGSDIPRGLEFLFSRNRLNVAISRAQCLAYLVGNPRLLEVRSRTVEQMRMVNALCRAAEIAESSMVLP